MDDPTARNLTIRAIFHFYRYPAVVDQRKSKACPSHLSYSRKAPLYLYSSLLYRSINNRKRNVLVHPEVDDDPVRPSIIPASFLGFLQRSSGNRYMKEASCDQRVAESTIPNNPWIDTILGRRTSYPSAVLARTESISGVSSAPRKTIYSTGTFQAIINFCTINYNFQFNRWYL